jgi:DNA-directed RNA polymerase subunit RPC12/RpoP
VTMTMGRLPEGTPIVCRTCGGAMTLAADFRVSCRHCGAQEMLPADELGRVLEIKNRLAVAEQRAVQVRGMDASLAHMFEDRGAFLRVSGMYLAVAFAVLAYTGIQLFSLSDVFDKVGAKDAGQMVLGSMLGPTIMLGLGASFAVSLAVGRAHYRRTVRPLLLAKPPERAGMRLRCRVCGGDLPETHAADVRCAYCNSVNLAPKELQSGHAHALSAEADKLRAQVSGTSIATMSIAKRMRVALIVCMVLTATAAYGIPMAWPFVVDALGL